MNDDAQRWHRESRFWRITPWVVVLSAALSVYLQDGSVFIAVTAPWITVAGGKSFASTWKGSGP